MIIDGMHYSEECSCQNCREITTRHRINRRVLEKETMNEPQLSAEMEKRFDEEFDHFVLDVGESGETVDWDRVKHFLATALEEQKEEVIEELLKHMRKVMFEWHGTGWAMVDDYKERFLNRKDTNE